MKIIKKYTSVIYMGLLWGLTELVIGYFLHMLKAPLTGSLLMPVGIICMVHVYLKTGSKTATIFTSVIAASIKVLTVLAVPADNLYLVINPVVAILLEGLILVIPISLSSKGWASTRISNMTLNRISNMAFNRIFSIAFNFIVFFTMTVFYKFCFLTFQVFLKAKTGAPSLGQLNLQDNFSFLFTETLITVSLVVVYLYLRHIPKYSKV